MKIFSKQNKKINTIIVQNNSSEYKNLFNKKKGYITEYLSNKYPDKAECFKTDYHFSGAEKFYNDLFTLLDPANSLNQFEAIDLSAQSEKDNLFQQINKLIEELNQKSINDLKKKLNYYSLSEPKNPNCTTFSKNIISFLKNNKNTKDIHISSSAISKKILILFGLFSERQEFQDQILEILRINASEKSTHKNPTLGKKAAIAKQEIIIQNPIRKNFFTQINPNYQNFNVSNFPNLQNPIQNPIQQQNLQRSQNQSAQPVNQVQAHYRLIEDQSTFPKKVKKDDNLENQDNKKIKQDNKSEI